MIAYLEGTVDSVDLEHVVLDVNGVGYEVAISHSDVAQLDQGKPAKLFIYEHIREDIHDLYGFSRRSTKGLFELLLSVKNVGPKVAMAVLGVGSPDSIKAAIAGGDVKLLQSAKGVGKRAAEQMVVELRDKLGLVAGPEAENLVVRAGIDLSDEAIQGLVALGYTEADAQRALANIDKGLPTEQRIKQALKG